LTTILIRTLANHARRAITAPFYPTILKGPTPSKRYLFEILRRNWLVKQSKPLRLSRQSLMTISGFSTLGDVLENGATILLITASLLEPHTSLYNKLRKSSSFLNAASIFNICLLFIRSWLTLHEKLMIPIMCNPRFFSFMEM
jgi:hypothetical protein